MLDSDEDDDFGDLYAAVKATAGRALTELLAESENSGSPEARRGVKAAALGEGGGWNTSENGVENDRGGEESQSESEDDFDIVLNDDEGGEIGRNGGLVFDNEDENRIEELDVGSNGMKDDGRRGRDDCNGGSDCNTGYKHLRFLSAAFLNSLKSNGSAGIPFYSTLVGGNRENRSFSSNFGHKFSLPRSRTILDVNIDKLEWKPWRHPGADITDFFNFGLDEDSWKGYCNTLDCFRGKKSEVNDYPACEPWRQSKQHEIEAEHKLLAEAAEERGTVSKQRRAHSPSQEISCREQQSELPKGKAIQVKDCIGERQPYIGFWHPGERDLDVIIEIPVQDIEENLPISAEGASDGRSSNVHESSDNGESGEVTETQGQDLLSSSSAGEDELPIEVPTEETRRCFKHTSACDCIPTFMDSDDCGSVLVSEADEHHQQEMSDGDSDGSTVRIGSSDDPRKRIGNEKPITAHPESPRSEQNGHSPNVSPFQSLDLASRDVEPDRCHGRSKRASSNSISEVQDSVLCDYHSSKDSRSHCVKMKSGDYEYYPRSRSPLRRNDKFHEMESTKMSELKSYLDYQKACVKMKSGDYEYYPRSRSPLRRNDKFHEMESTKMSELKSYLDYQKALYPSESEKLRDYPHTPSERFNQRNGNHDVDYLEREDVSYYEGSDQSFNYGEGKFCEHHVSAVTARNSHRRGSLASGYERDRVRKRSVDGKDHFTGRGVPSSSDNVMKQHADPFESRLSDKQMDSLNCHGPRQFISEQSPFPDSRNHNRRKLQKSEEMHYKRRTEYNNFIPECFYSNEYTRENYRCFQYDTRERDVIQHKYDRWLSYGRREVRSPVIGKRKSDSPLNDFENINHVCCDNEEIRDARNQFSVLSYKEPCNSGRGRWKDASFSRSNIRRRDNCFKSYKSSKFGSQTRVFGNDENFENPHDQDRIARGRLYIESEVLHWREDKYRSWHTDRDFQADRILNPFKRISRFKRSGVKHGCGHGGGDLIDYKSEQNSCKTSRKGNNACQFHQNSTISRTDIVCRTLPWNEISTHRYMAVGNRKPARYFVGENIMSYCRHQNLDSNDLSYQRDFENLDESQLEKIVGAENSRRVDTFKDANHFHKFPDAKRNDLPDIEEGQIITEDFDEEPKENTCAPKDGTNIMGSQKLSSENPKILEVIAKMEKRRERFKQPLRNVSEKHGKPLCDKVAKTVEISKVDRPARKRRWVVS